MTVDEVARAWDLEPHPEGGYYRETYRSAVELTPPGWPGAACLVAPGFDFADLELR